jgi:hypothetical protein
MRDAVAVFSSEFSVIPQRRRTGFIKSAEEPEIRASLDCHGRAASEGTSDASHQIASVSSDRRAQDLRQQTDAKTFGPPTLADEVPG